MRHLHLFIKGHHIQNGGPWISAEYHLTKSYLMWVVRSICSSQCHRTSGHYYDHYHNHARGGGGIRLIVGFQPIVVISLTVSWIRWCMRVYAWWWNEDLSCLGHTIYARQFLGAKPPIQFRHRWAERNHSDHLYWLQAALTHYCQAPSWKAQASHF